VPTRVHQPERHRLHLLLQTWIHRGPRQHLQLPGYTHAYTRTHSRRHWLIHLIKNPGGKTSLQICREEQTWPELHFLSSFLNFTTCLFPPPDINECEVWGTCPQICKNTKGSYDCECASGYRKVGDGSMCEAEGENYLFNEP